MGFGVRLVNNLDILSFLPEAGALVGRPPVMIFLCQTTWSYVLTKISGGRLDQGKNSFGDLP